MKFFNYIAAECFRVLRSFQIWIILGLGTLFLLIARFSGPSSTGGYLQVITMLILQMHVVIALLIFAPFYKSSHQYRSYLLRNGSRIRMLLGDIVTADIMSLFVAVLLGAISILCCFGLRSTAAVAGELQPIPLFVKSLAAYSVAVMLLYPFISLIYAMTKSGAAATSLSVILQFLLPSLASQLRLGGRLIHKVFNLIYWLSPSTYALEWIERGRIENMGNFALMLGATAAVLAANLILISRRSY